jgi:RNA polymerase sporulation-specific sigma factor
VSLNKPVSAKDDDAPLEYVLTSRAIDDPAELVVSAEQIAHIKDSMGALLSDLETEVLQLYMDGKSYQQIADMLGRHVKSIDNALQRIKRKLEQHLTLHNAELAQ